MKVTENHIGQIIQNVKAKHFMEQWLWLISDFPILRKVEKHTGYTIVVKPPRILFQNNFLDKW